MFPISTFLLDVSPYLLLKTPENSDLTFCSMEVKEKRWLCSFFHHGETVISFNKPSFSQHRSLLNPHSDSQPDEPAVCPTRRCVNVFVLCVNVLGNQNETTTNP